MSNGKKIAIVSGSTHIRLAKAISRELSKEHGIPLTKDKIIVFNNGERNVKLLETVRGAEVFIIQSSLTKKVDNNWTETLFLIDASRRAGASKVYLVQTILPYARQDRRETNGHGSPVRTSIGAYVVIKTYEAMGADGVITMKLHSDQIEGFFDNRTII